MLLAVVSVFFISFACTGCPIKMERIKKNSDASCFKLTIKCLFFSKSAIISLNFDILFRIFGDLVAELKDQQNLNIFFRQNPIIAGCTSGK